MFDIKAPSFRHMEQQESPKGAHFTDNGMPATISTEYTATTQLMRSHYAID